VPEIKGTIAVAESGKRIEAWVNIKTLIMDKEKEKNITGDQQAAFAGTNTNRYRQPNPAEKQDNPIQDEEAQNVTDSPSRLSGEDAEHARRKANERQSAAE
jgi:hypothetical protein